LPTQRSHPMSHMSHDDIAGTTIRSARWGPLMKIGRDGGATSFLAEGVIGCRSDQPR